jgi:hypothetical protein
VTADAANPTGHAIGPTPAGAERVLLVGALTALVLLAGSLVCMLAASGGPAGLPAAQRVLAGLTLMVGAGLSAWVIRAARPGGVIRSDSPGARSPTGLALARVGAVLLPVAMAAGWLAFEGLQSGCARMLFYLLVVTMEAVLLSLALPSVGQRVTAGLAIVLPAVAWKVASYAAALSTAPFSLGWSEASRYYYASLFASSSVYGEQTAWPVLHPARYLLQALPFLLGNPPIAVHRIWQVVLWLGVTAAVGAALAWRWEGRGSWRFVLLAGWGFLFLFQGPVYYHLALGVLPLLIGFRWNRPWRNLLLVLIGSLWAGLSRVNWYPVPGLLAAALLALESPAASTRRWSLREWRWPAIWVAVGSLAALVASLAYVRASGNSPDQFASSLSSQLLWYRLLPSATNPLGIVPGLILAALPPILLLGASLRQPIGGEPARVGLLLAVLGVLLLGGLVVSVKIGGGGDLHNLDAFLLVLLVISGGAWVEWNRNSAGAFPPARQLLLTLVLLVPAGFAVLSGQAGERVDVAAQRAELGDLRERLQAVDGPVLFLSQRHLLTFDEIEVPLVEPYEKVHLMEMAMSRNPAYLAQFRGDLASHRFALVVSDSLNSNRQGSQHAFGEENDAWLDSVVLPLLESYQVIARLPEAGVWLLVPRDA